MDEINDAIAEAQARNVMDESLYDAYMPRKPLLDEIAEIKGAAMKEYGLDEDEATYVESAYIAVYDNYQTDCPGYCGKVAVALYGGAPAFVESYVWRDGVCEVEGRTEDG